MSLRLSPQAASVPLFPMHNLQVEGLERCEKKVARRGEGKGELTPWVPSFKASASRTLSFLPCFPRGTGSRPRGSQTQFQVGIRLCASRIGDDGFRHGVSMVWRGRNPFSSRYVRPREYGRGVLLMVLLRLELRKDRRQSHGRKGVGRQRTRKGNSWLVGLC